MLLILMKSRISILLLWILLLVSCLMNLCLTQDHKRSVFSPRDCVVVCFTFRPLIHSEKIVNASFLQWIAAPLSSMFQCREVLCPCPTGTFSRACAPPFWRFSTFLSLLWCHTAIAYSLVWGMMHTHTQGGVVFFFLIKNKEEFYNVNVRFKMSLLSFKYLLKTFKGLPVHWKRFWSIESLAVENEISQEVDFWKQWLICFHWSQESKITIHSVW